MIAASTFQPILGLLIAAGVSWFGAASPLASTVVGDVDRRDELLSRLEQAADESDRVSIYAALLARLPQEGDATLLDFPCSDEGSPDLRFACSSLVALAQPLGQEATAPMPSSPEMQVPWLVQEARGQAHADRRDGSLSSRVAGLLRPGAASDPQAPVDGALLELLRQNDGAIVPRTTLGRTLLLAEAIGLGPPEEKARITRVLAKGLDSGDLVLTSSAVERAACRIFGRPDQTPLLIFGPGRRLARTEILKLAQLRCVRMGPQLLAVVLGALTEQSSDTALAVRALGRASALPPGTTGRLRDILINHESGEARRAAIEVLGSRDRRALEAVLPTLDKTDPGAAEHARQVLALVRLQSATR